jgi:hypothetical protein
MGKRLALFIKTKLTPLKVYDLVSELAMLAGFLLAAYGIYLIYTPAAFIFAGVGLFLFGFPARRLK